MKKFWLCLGIALILACWSGKGYYGFGTCPAFGQPYYDGNLSCDPSDPNCYNEYYAAPAANPLAQLLYYVAPPVVVVQPGYGRGRGYEGHEGGHGGEGRGGGKAQEEHRR
jgi:hypothetical protein